MIKNILKVLFGVTVGAGLLVVLGTAGSSDLGLIDWTTVLVRSVIGVGLVLVGLGGFKIIDPNSFN
jgi:hypothetical protein